MNFSEELYARVRSTDSPRLSTNAELIEITNRSASRRHVLSTARGNRALSGGFPTTAGQCPPARDSRAQKDALRSRTALRADPPPTIRHVALPRSKHIPASTLCPRADLAAPTPVVRARRCPLRDVRQCAFDSTAAGTRRPSQPGDSGANLKIGLGSIPDAFETQHQQRQVIRSRLGPPEFAHPVKQAVK